MTAMPFTRLQIALLGVALGLAALALGRLVGVEFAALNAAALDQQPED